jgi:hypothetical protein
LFALQNGGSINGKESVTFFKKSGLAVDILKKVWVIASTDSTSLNKDEFNVAMRLLAYA